MNISIVVSPFAYCLIVDRLIQSYISYIVRAVLSLEISYLQ